MGHCAGTKTFDWAYGPVWYALFILDLRFSMSHPTWLIALHMHQAMGLCTHSSFIPLCVHYFFDTSSVSMAVEQFTSCFHVSFTSIHMLAYGLLSLRYITAITQRNVRIPLLPIVPTAHRNP